MIDENIASGADVTDPNIVQGENANTDKGTPSEQITDPKADETGAWGEDWRQKLAKGDEKRLERLGRFSSPDAILTAFEESQKKISEGLKPKGRPGEKATDAEWAEYRKAQGIPDAVDDYVKAIELPDKRQIGDEDKPIVSAFAERAIKRGIEPKVMSEMVDEYYALQEKQQELLAEQDATFKASGMAALKEEYGGDYKANIAAMRPYFESVNAELFDKLFAGRMADGSVIGNNPEIVKFFVSKALAENPLATVVPSGGNADGLETEIKALEKRMGEDRDAWFKDTAAQDRYQKLLSARDKLAAK